MQHFETESDTPNNSQHSLPPPPPAAARPEVSAVVAKNKKGRGETIAGILGSIMEWYDFAIFGYFSDVIAEVFFPPQKGHAALLQSFSIFGAAYLMRPIGGVILGKMGDTYGRKIALEISILLMAAATFVMGCLPSYNAIGWPAIVCLLATRLVQGASVGGQLMSSLVFTLERRPRDTWGFYGAVVMGAASMGVLVGSFVGYGIRQSLSEEDLKSWGWRIPFLAGVVVSGPGLYLRWHAQESDIDRQIREQEKDALNPIQAVFSPKHRRALLACSLVPMVGSGGFYLTFVWLAIFMETLLDPPVSHAFLINSLSLAFTAAIYLLVGHCSDKYFKRTHIMYVGGILMAIFGPLMVIVVAQGTMESAFLAQIIMGILLSFWGAPMNAWLVESFPHEVRLTALSIGYNFAQATIGGFTPVFATLMLEHHGKNSPGFMMTILALISMFGLVTAPKRQQQQHEEEEEEDRRPGSTHHHHHHHISSSSSSSPPHVDSIDGTSIKEVV